MISLGCAPMTGEVLVVFVLFFNVSRRKLHGRPSMNSRVETGNSGSGNILRKFFMRLVTTWTSTMSANDVRSP